MSSSSSATKENQSSPSLLFGFGQVKNIDRILTTDEALSMARKAIDSWKNVTSDAIAVTNISAGYLNSLWLVERKDAQVDGKIVIRFYGGNNSSPWKKEELFDHGYGRDLESVVACAASDAGIGPKVHVTADTFRIEQFIECRNFTWDDYNDDYLLGQFARNLARFHSLIQRDELKSYREVKGDLFARGQDIFTRYRDRWPRVCELARQKYRYTGEDNDLFDEFDEMKKLSSKLNLQKGLINWDLNTMNILVRNTLANDDELKTVLIDYEFAHCNWRCFDIGITTLRTVLGSPVSGDKLYFTDDEIFSGLMRFENIFLRTYHEEYIKRCHVSCAIDETDTWQNLLLETYFGACWTWIFSFANLMLFMFPLIPDEDKVIDLLAKKLSASFHFHKCVKSKLFQLNPLVNDNL